MDKTDAILAQLNPSQQEAVRKIEGPVMVIAGAGSGKTRVLTYRIAYMLEKGIPPWQILALTFTNKAAGEMKERIFKLIGDSQAKSVVMGTFHSVFYRILRTEGEKLGYSNNLTVYDTDDSKTAIKSIVKEMNLDPKVYVATQVLNRISAAKSSLLSAEEYAQNPDIVAVDTQSGKPHIGEIFMRYNARLTKSDAMAFDDLLYYMNVLLRDFPEMLYKYQNRYRYIMVDEYQDTNFAQYMIVKKLSAAHQNLCVVGDDAQSIYAFRGANIQNILNFKRDYPKAQIVKLEQNYRSTQNIVNAANALIKYNKDQLPKQVWTSNDEGNKIDIIASSTDVDEANFVSNNIMEVKLNQHIDNSHFAILYRTNAQSRALEESLIKHHIPYKIYAGLSFYKRKEIKDLLAYFRLAINNFDEESLRRVINYPQRGIGETTLERVIVAANEQNVRMWHVVEDPDTYLDKEVYAPTKKKLKEFASLIKSYTAMLQRYNAYDLGVHIAKTSGIISDLKQDQSEKDRLENIEEVLDALKQFSEKTPEQSFNEETGELIENFMPTLDRYVESIALLTDTEEDDKENSNKVKLMTIHAAKGLEFDYVYITGMEENLFPSSMSIGSRAELEEERRLFYVAVTRAKVQLTLTHANMRFKFGSLQFAEPSRFLSEIPIPYVNWVEKASSGRGDLSVKRSHGFSNETRSSQTSSGTSESGRFVPRRVAQVSAKKPAMTVDMAAIGKLAKPADIVPDLTIYHAKFGYGKVVSVEGPITDKKALIHFDSVGDKTLLLNFAKLLIPKK
ncbi:MAG: UvrD-helicase domain-containing protein [Bacteroidales bacterium]|nr:UvrD-helicase domain-containing protein [Bacteroidales bacterium]